MPAKPEPPLAAGPTRHHDEIEIIAASGANGFAPAGVPIYIPYAIGYEPEKGDGDSQETSQEDPWYDSDSWEDNAEAEEIADQPVVVQPATELVFRDGHHTSVVNYAIVGDALFDFDEGVTRKIMLADIDIAATGRANGVRGVDFNLPAGSLGPATK